MANEQVSIKRGLKANIPSTKTAGQILVATDTGEMFVDDSTSSRIQIKDPTKAPVDHTHPAQTSVTGNAGTATKLATARTINGTSFDGSANITTANWGTARTITIGSTGKSVNGSGNITWTLNDLGAVSGGFHVSQSGKTAAGWYRIATSISGIGNCNGIFIVTGSASGVHDSVVFTAGTCYGVTSGTYLSQLGCASYTSTNITKARIVYNTTYSNNYAYLEVYVNTSVSTAIDAKFFGTGWSRVDATTGSIPSGYTSKEISFNNTVAFIGSLSGSATSLAGGMTYNSSAMIATDKIAVFEGNTVRPMTIDNMKTNLIGDASTSQSGLMTPAMVTKLNGIAAGANAYSLPVATESVHGGVKIGSNITVSSGTISLTKANVTSALGYTPPTTDTNTTYTAGTGLSLSGTKFSVKLGYTTSGKNYKVTNDTSGNLYVNVPWTDTNTTYSVMGAASSSAAGTSGLVPAPAAGKQSSFLRGDGTWVVPPNTDTKVTQSAAITSAGAFPVLLGYSTSTSAVTDIVHKAAAFTYNPSTQTLSATYFNGTLDDGSIDD